MRTRTKVVIGAVIAVVALGATAAVAGPLIYRDVIAAPASEVPLLSADESAVSGASGETLEPAQFDGTWAVAEGSYAGYRVDEVLNGTPVTVTGRTSEVTGSFTFTDLTLEAAQFEVDVASIATDRPQRDGYFRDQAMRSATHPTATFVLTTPVTAEKAPAAGEVVEQTLNGDLTIAGVTRQVTFSVQVRTDATTAEIAGQIPITFADFGVEAPNLGFVAVEQTGFVEFSLVAVLE